MKKRTLLWLGLAVLAIFALDCGASHVLIKENGFDTIDVAVLQLVGGNATQTIDNVTVTVKPYSAGADELVIPIAIKRNEAGYCASTFITTEKLVPILKDNGSLPVFEFRIENKTDHVIVFGTGNQAEGSSAVVAYVPEGGSPVFPVAGGLAELVGPAMGDQFSQATLRQGMQAKLEGVFKQKPRLNLGLQVLPGYPAVGLVVFDYALLQGSDKAELRIFDLVTQVDATGKATKKASFSWKFRVVKGKASAVAGALGPAASTYKTTKQE
jgi:hypothetical protein